MTSIGIMGTVSPWMSGGAAVHPAELMKALSGRYAFKTVTPATADRHLPPSSPDVKCVTAVPYISSLSQIAAAVRFLRDVDLLHSHDPRLYAVKKFVSKPLITTIHGYLTLEAMANYHTAPGKPRYEIYRQVLNGCVSSSDFLIAVDTRIASWLVREFDAASVITIPNGVDVDRFRPRGASREVVQVYGVPPNSLTILAAKHFVAKNGMETLLRAMPQVVEEIPNAHLLLAGHGRLKSRVESVITQLGIDKNVTMAGQIPNELMQDVICASDVGVIPSIPVAGVEEATSIVMLEMMACGKPVVASAIGGLRETIRHGETGFLVEPANPAALARSLVSLLEDASLRKEVGLKARRYIEQNCSWAVIANRVAAVYQRVLAS